MANPDKFKSLNVDPTTHQCLRILSAATKRSIVSVVRGMTQGLTVQAFTALERANEKRLEKAREEGTS